MGGRRTDALVLAAATQRTRQRGPLLAIENLDVHYGRAHALQQVSLDARRAACSPSSAATAWARRRCATPITGLVPARGSIRLARRGDPRPAAARDHRARRRLRPAGPARLAVALGRRAPAARRAAIARTVDAERVYQTFPRLAERKRNGGARALRRRAADARDRARAAVQSAPAGDGRADRRPGAGHRRAGREDADDARRRRRDRGAADRAEPRRRDRRRRHGRRDGERPHRALDARGASSPPTASCSSACSAFAPARRGAEARAEARRRGETADAARVLHRAARERTTPPSADARTRRPTSRAPCAASRAGTPPMRHARPRDRLVERAPSRRAETPSLADAAQRLARQRPRCARASSSRWRRARRARPTSPARSTPRAASSSSCASCLEKLGVRTVTVDLATSGKPSPAMVHPREVARHHPRGERAVFTGDRGSAVDRDGGRVRALRHAAARPRRPHLRRRLRRHRAGDAAMRRLPVGVPKVMVSTRRLGRRASPTSGRRTSA